ncbi:Linear gramicidin synthase subunit D [Talaromyces pinophilus]|nr:Linear gramicidin synthase subunit D [Talaromyces pinophilus]
MEQILIQRASSAPEAAAFLDGDFSISYRQLIARADMLAQSLDSEGVKCEEPVCIYLESSYEQVLAQVAVLRAGGTCVPIEPSTPALRVASMLHDIEARYIITKKRMEENLHDFKIIYARSTTEEEITVDRDSITSRADCPVTHRSHIMFTSGSTGKPKPIQILAGGILHVLHSFPCLLLNPSERMSLFINPGFDFSLFEIWGALLSGATIVRVPKVIITDPVTLGNFLQNAKVKAMIIPTALFNVIALHAPASSGSLRHILVGGEAVNTAAMREVLANNPPEYLWDAYGPAEATIYATLCQVDEQEAKYSRISIGRPLGQTKVYLLDEQGRRITDTDKWGEISIAGPQVSPGYLNRPKETEEHFVIVDASVIGEESPTRLYRTGDIGQWRDSAGFLNFIGRSDKQIKRAGHRVELGDIERTLEECPDVHSCAVISSQEELSETLVAYVIPTSWEDVFEPSGITRWAEERLPPYMVPDQVQRVPKFPLTPNGKLDRDALSHNTENQTEKESGGKETPHASPTNAWLQSTVAKLLKVPHVNPDDNIFLQGLTSLQAAQLIAQIMHHYGKRVALQDVHAHPTVRRLEGFIQNITDKRTCASDTMRWEMDAHLADDALRLPDWQNAQEAKVFLTGATGFAGAYMLARLLSMQTVKKVACLARGRGEQTPASRIQQALEKYRLWDGSLERTQKIIVIEGDLEDDTLGMTEDHYKWLAKWASVIFHVGAKVNWCEPYEAHFESNVLGTRNVIKLAGQGRLKPLHYLSSIDAWNVTGFINKTKQVLEDEPLKPHAASLPYDMGYAQSQWVADEMVQRARARGLPTAIYRPGFILGDSKRAIRNPDDFFARFIMACIQIRLFPHLPRQRLEYVTIDYVCSAMLHIASKIENLGRAYHLLSPDPTQSVSIEGTYELLIRAGFPMEKVSYPDWVNKIQEHSESPLQPMLPMLQELVFKDFTRMQTSTETPVYNTQNAVQALADRPEIKYVPLSHELLKRYVDFWIERHYYSL